MELSRNCVKVQVPCACHKMLAQKLNEIIRSGHIIHKTNGTIVSVSLILSNFYLSNIVSIYKYSYILIQNNILYA